MRVDELFVHVCSAVSNIITVRVRETATWGLEFLFRCPHRAVRTTLYACTLGLVIKTFFSSTLLSPSPPRIYVFVYVCIHIVYVYTYTDRMILLLGARVPNGVYERLSLCSPPYQISLSFSLLPWGI